MEMETVGNSSHRCFQTHAAPLPVSHLPLNLFLGPQELLGMLEGSSKAALRGP